MRAMSFMRQMHELVPINIELTLVPGLPQIVFIGLPDASVRESALRIRSAIRKQGFKLPKAQRILVNLTPGHLRKTSGGLDLAVAAALLWETKQIAAPLGCEIPALYGELTLSGAVEIPEDTSNISQLTGALYTGISREELDFGSIQIGELRDLLLPPSVKSPPQTARPFVRPRARVSYLSARAAECLQICAAGEHSLLLAGPAGTGKTTLADLVPAFVRAPATEAESRYARKFSRARSWRPIVKPHHSITPLAMIGGGQLMWAGEMSRAHTGILILDELLEFAPAIQDALREPSESGAIHLARGGKNRKLDADFLLIATTNLCPCGCFVPGNAADRCRCTRLARRRVFSRLSGPFADRFSMITFSETWTRDEKKVDVTEIACRTARAIEFRVEKRGQAEPNAKACADSIRATLTDFQLREVLSGLNGQSFRREQAVLRVARTFADFRSSMDIAHEDLTNALELCLHGHQLFEQWRE